MNPVISLFVPLGEAEDLKQTLQEFDQSGLNISMFIMNDTGTMLNELPAHAETIKVASLFSTDAVRKMALHTKTPYILLYTKRLPLKLGAYALQRMLRIAEDTYSGMVYADHYAQLEGKTVPIPVIDYQDGSLRDDFNFGSLLLFESAAFLDSVSGMKDDYHYAGLYDLRLRLSRKYGVFHIPEFLYTEMEPDVRKSGEKLFDYVDPRNRQMQIEMEKACTSHLKEKGAWLEPRFRTIHFTETDFAHEVSVVIPVKNRARTIADAIQSVLRQHTTFAFNVLVIDNHSDDGTGEIIDSFSRRDQRVIHIQPGRYDLGIGGCWNMAVFHPSCGRFAIQLDSDDLYIDEMVLSKITDAFYAQNCAMLIGSYRMVNFDLKEIPPGVIDHKEWTPDNGRNNALRINGLGAPRAFYTPVLRSIMVPNVSYGEDYAVGLQISRYYQIGRIYEPLYLCRRWEENSDASLDVQKMNSYNFYKDKIRTIEFYARQRYVQEGQESV
jgi:hypothetical protein